MVKSIFLLICCIISQVSINAMEKFPLHAAAAGGDLTQVVELLRYGADINLSDPVDGFTALHHAATNGHADIVKYLLNHEAKIDKPDNLCLTPLHLAAKNGWLDVVEVLLNSGANATRRNLGGSTPFDLAVTGGHREIVELLADGDVEDTWQEEPCSTPSYCAYDKDHQYVVQWLQKQSKKLEQLVFETAVNELPLHTAAAIGDDKMVYALLLSGSDINLQDKIGSTPLHWAATNGHALVVQQLLAHGADINLKNGAGFTALSSAAVNDNREVVKLLLDSGADANLQDLVGFTSLQLADCYGNQEVVLMIMRHIKRIVKFQAGILAGAMHPRLGANSPIGILPDGIMKLIFEYLMKHLTRL